MFYLTWFAGIAVFIDIWVLIVLSIYLINNLSQRFTTSYCLAFGTFLYVLGHGIERGWAFYSFLQEKHYIPWNEITEKYPIAGSLWCAFGALIVMIGLLKLQKVFSESYIGGVKSWVYPIIVSLIVPLILIYLI